MKKISKTTITKTPKENIIDTLKGKKVLFLENDNVLENGLELFEAVLKEAKIKYTIQFGLFDLDIQEIIKLIEKHDAIVFQTQWLYENSRKISEYMWQSKNPKIVIECYISEPTWYYQPDAIHPVYIYQNSKWSGERFYKLTQEPYWNYENKFDK